MAAIPRRAAGTHRADGVIRAGARQCPGLAPALLEAWYRTPLCSLGIHSGEGTYVAEGDCTQAKTRERCGVTHTRTKHRLQWQYIRDASCWQNRVCARCEDVSDTRTKHEKWGEWYSLNAVVRGDDVAQRCERCADVRTGASV